MTDASRKAKERASRKAKGEKRVEVWLDPDESYRLDAMVDTFENINDRAQALRHLVRFGQLE